MHGTSRVVLGLAMSVVSHPASNFNFHLSVPAVEVERECGVQDAGVSRGDTAGGGTDIAR